jgi:hypothetical protein
MGYEAVAFACTNIIFIDAAFVQLLQSSYLYKYVTVCHNVPHQHHFVEHNETAKTRLQPENNLRIPEKKTRAFQSGLIGLLLKHLILLIYNLISSFLGGIGYALSSPSFFVAMCIADLVT